MKRNVLSAAAIALCLALFGAFPSLAEEAIHEKTTSDPLERFFHAGWVQVSSGVLTRDLGGGKVEVLGFGAEGLRYRLQEMRKHLRHLKATYEQYPTPDLKDSIRAYRTEIRRIMERLRIAKRANEIEATTNIDCTNDYGVHVNAFALTGSAQGVGASATAYFNSDCGQRGEVWSTAYGEARRADNSVWTATKRDPLSDTYSGTNVRAAGSISLNGVTNCFSYAYADVTSYDIGVVYWQRAENRTCVPAPIQDHPMTGQWSGTVAGYASELTIEGGGGVFSALLSMDQANQPVEQVEIRSISETELILYRPADNAILRMTRTLSDSQVCLIGDYLEDGFSRPISLCKDHPMLGVWSGTVAGYASELTIEEGGGALSALLSMDQAPVEQVEIRSISEKEFTLYRPGDDAILQMTRTRSGSQECLIGWYREDGSSRLISLCKAS